MQHLVSYGRSVFLKKEDSLFLNFLPDAELGVLVDEMPCEVKGMAALDGQHLLICKLYSLFPHLILSSTFSNYRWNL